MPPHPLTPRALFLDLEVTRAGHIRDVGAVLGDRSLRLERPRHADWARLDAFAAPAQIVVGHNILEHDLPHLARVVPGLALLRKPAVDTLVLSPIAFPRRPYHALVKEHRLVKDAANDPVADARLCARLLDDEWGALGALADDHPLPGLLYHALDRLSEGRPWAGGFEPFLRAFGPHPASASDALAAVTEGLGSVACIEGLARLQERLAGSQGLWVPFAYAASWLLLADPGSVLPGWVRHRHPTVPSMLAALRDQPCARADCGWCQGEHDPEVLLKRFFDFDGFRAEPPDPRTGGSLQRAITAAGLGGRSLYAMLPTGGGKSICFQLPALVRHQRLGLLTVVISPLQSLMKDQVDGLIQATDTQHAAALHGMVTAPERSRVLQEVADGTVGLLYVSPEQLRNRSVRKAIKQRQIAAWVFDEAHCLSKWGHDFRTDYLYTPRFILELAQEQGEPGPPPVACFTATSQKAVTAEIRSLFREQLGHKMELFETGIERDNLIFEVQQVRESDKLGCILDTLARHVGPELPGAAIVFNATRRKSEELAQALVVEGWSASAYHAGLNPHDKRGIQDRFLAGELRVICATSAFGMGIDKPDVRLVIHAEIPGSLESYLQQAGRAGRDRKDAQCVLMACEPDLETQFQLWARSRLTQEEIASVLRAVRRARRGEGSVVVTPGELLRMEETAASLEPDDSMGPTKVATAVTWLERAAFLERNQNVNHIFQGRPKVKSLEQAEARFDALNLPPQERRRWRSILLALMNADPDEGFNADDLAAMAAEDAGGPDGPSVLEAGLRVLQTLQQMSSQGLVSSGLRMSAFVRFRVKDPSSARLLAAIELERALLDLMPAEHPDAEDGEWADASMRLLNQRLLDEGCASTTQSVILVLKALSEDRALDGSGRGGSLDLRTLGRHRHRLRLLRPWEQVKELSSRRHAVAQATLVFLLTKVPAGAPASAEALVEFGLDELVDACSRDLILAARVQDFQAAAQRALLYLHELKVITLQNGLAVFRQAMTIDLKAEAKGRRYSRRDYEPLHHHYEERVIQIHVMGEYARIGAEHVGRAMRYTQEWFTKDRGEFLRTYFPEDTEVLGRATSQRSYQRIVEDLRNPDQQRIVTADPGGNLLVLAGPGSGKTRTLVHRCGWLVRVQRVAPAAVLLLCYNRSTAHELRRRLRELIGDDARGVTISTLHGLALRITGRSLADAQEEAGQAGERFDAILDEASALLEGCASVCGLEQDELRERLLEGYRHILVDEYQDIDERQYRLISAITGRSCAEGADDLRLSILAVGDDDQNIYAFRGASTRFIRQFHEDYRATIHHLTANYRSTAAIIAASNALIQHAPDRMKREQPIHIDTHRRHRPPGGLFESLDPQARGRVQLVETPSQAGEAAFVLAEMRRLRRLDGNVGWGDLAVFARSRRDLWHLRALLEECAIPCRRELGGRLALHRVREVAMFLEALEQEGARPLYIGEVMDLLTSLQAARPDHVWWRQLREQVEHWAEELGESPRTAVEFRRDLWESLADQGRQQQLGQGVLLGTLHSAKGLEFPHVFLLGCGRGGGSEDRDAERRLLYVGMTRARRTLCMSHGQRHAASFIDELDDPAMLLRSAAPAAPQGEPPCFEIIGLGDLYIDWAGRRSPGHPLHARLAALDVGDAVELSARGCDLLVVDGAGHPVARLSREAQERWAPRLERPLSLQVIAMVRRHASQVAAEYADKLRTDRWELPVVEVRVG